MTQMEHLEQMTRDQLKEQIRQVIKEEYDEWDWGDIEGAEMNEFAMEDIRELLEELVSSASPMPGREHYVISAELYKKLKNFVSDTWG